MSNPTTAPDEFAAVMQQLSAEAKKSIVPPAQGHTTRASGASGSAGHSVEARLQSLESTLSKKIDEVVIAVAQTRSREGAIQFAKIEEQLAAIRNSESVNQRLFDSLHDELLRYRDNFVHESLQKPFIHDLVHLFDDLTSLAGQLQSSGAEAKKRSHLGQWRDNLENAIHSLVEILHRFDVREIESKERVDRALHRVVSYELADYQEDDGRIVMRVKRGFVWRDKLIRPEEVIAKRYEG
jgi:molecular chaperone GrpE (heat shock protein)